MAEKIMAMLNKNKLIEVSEYLQELKIEEISNELIELDSNLVVLVFRLLPKDKSAQVFSYLDKKYQQNIIEAITDLEVKEIVESLSLDDMNEFIEELPANMVKKVLRNTSSDKRKFINKFLRYKEDSAGSIMKIEFIDLKEEMTVKQATEHIRNNHNYKNKSVETCFVIDKNRKLKGIINLKELILNDEEKIILDIMDKNIIYTKTTEDQEQVASLFKQHDLVYMAVVDKEDRLVGMVTVDDVVDIIEQENTEDFQKMAAMTPNEEQYLKTPIRQLAKDRIIWLLVLMISATVTGAIIRDFEEVIQSVVILASFIPMLMDTGGNAGSQSSTLVIRGLALGDIKVKDYLKVMFKEFRVSLVVATVLATVNFLRICLLERVEVKVSLVVCGSLFFTVIIAKVVGGVLPIIAKKLKFDPAVMASPLITTVVDAFALMVYFSLAKVFLGI